MRKLEKILLVGGIGILSTDTLYGLVGLALSRKAVQRIYKIRRRNLKKPFIILIGRLEDLNLFGIKLDRKTKKLLENLWPGKISVILPCFASKFFYLHRGTNTLAFRLPEKRGLRNLLKKIGPLVAPSANPEGLPPAKNISEAKRYFKDRVDFYSTSGKSKFPASTLISLENGKINVIRQGAVKIYKCGQCGFHYLKAKIAKKCEIWCRERNSCNLEFIKDALENKK